MIKNILYSLLFHFAILLLIYFSFKKFQKIKNIEIRTVDISILNLKTKKNIEIKEKLEAKIEEKKEKKVEEKKKEKKPEPKKKIEKKEKPKKISKKPKTKQKKEKEKAKEEKKVEEKKEEIKNIEPEIEELKDLKISQRNKFNIKSQLNSCFSRIFSEQNQKFDMDIILDVDQKGNLFFDDNKNIDKEKYKNDENYQNFIKNIKEIVIFCSPIRDLPEEEYKIWKEFRLKFIAK